MIPRDKFDCSSIEKMYALTDNQMAEIVYDLLEWIQDINWPVAQKLIPVLLERENLIFPYIIDILNKDDYTWKYCVLDFLIPNFSITHKEQLKGNILKLINDPNNDEDTIALREIAIECYNRCFDN